MSIATTVANLIMEEVIRDLLKTGTRPTLAAVSEAFATATNGLDLSQPRFLPDTYKVTSSEVSSATKFNSTKMAIWKDLVALYADLYNNTELSVGLLDRWRTEFFSIGRRLEDLDNRVEALLLLSQDANGFKNVIVGQFNTANYVDLANSTARIDPATKRVTIPASRDTATRINLNGLLKSAVEINVVSKKGLYSHSIAPGTDPMNAIRDTDGFWQSRVSSATFKDPVFLEFKITLSELTEISKITIKLLASNQNSAIQITPLLSADGINFQQIDSPTFTINVISEATFCFTPVDVKVVKLLMSKTASDYQDGRAYIYEFGAKEIALFDTGYTTSATMYTPDLILEDSSARGFGGSQVGKEFQKVSLEVCETVPTDTAINYSIAVGSSTIDPLTANWIPIDPMTRAQFTKPTILELGNLLDYEYTGVGISYTASTDNTLVNPGTTFSLVSSAMVTSVVTADPSNPRYVFFNTEDRILDYQFNKDIDIDLNNLEVWRNVGTKGGTTRVRSIIAGWGFLDPYYYTVVDIQNIDGHDVDLGDKGAIVDEEIVTGKLHLDYGKHSVRVFKEYWREVTPELTSLTELKAADSLYPYNHRYIFEGYDYSSSWLETEEQVYTGADRFAEFYMKRISILDLQHSVLANDFTRYALDYDIGSTITPRDKSRVFVLKVDPKQADFISEKFDVVFKKLNSTFNTLRLRAVLSTTEETLTPALELFRIRLV